MIISLIVSLCCSAQAGLSAGASYPVPNIGKFDYMAVDADSHRVFASHPAAKSLAVLDMSTGKATDLDLGTAVNGVQIDRPLGILFVTGGGQKLIALDLKTLAVKNEVDLPGPGDDLAIDRTRQEIYVCNDDGTNLWVFEAKTLKPLATIPVPEAPEYIEYDEKTDRLYQNIKSNDTVQIIDAKTKKIVDSWATGAENKPHGLAVDRRSGRVFSAGANGKMDLFDASNGKVLSVLDIVPKTDQICFDPSWKRVYCAGAGSITVIQETPDGGAKVVGNVPSPVGVHTIAVDPKTHGVWVCYSNSSGAFFQKFDAKQ